MTRSSITKLRPRHLAGAFLALLAAGLSSCNQTEKETVQADEKQPPNILFIVVDDMGYAVPGCYGGRDIHTPKLDQLAREGMRFTQAYSGNPLCGPSRAALMLGKHNGKTSVRGNTGGISILEEDTTLAEVLQAAGYKTGGFGKWGLGDAGTAGVPWKQGFDEFYGYLHQIHAHFYYTEYLWDKGEKVVLNDGKISETYTHDLILAEMKKFIRENKDGPFFCFAPWTLPHADDVGIFVLPEDDPAHEPYQDKPWDKNLKGYAAMNTRVDSDVGEILELLDELGIADNTMVIFCSDNGAPKETNSEHFNPSGKLRGFKRSMYEGGVRIPQIVRWPGKTEAGSVSDLQTYFPDLMPTFAEVAGGSKHLPAGIDGLSIVPTLTGKPQEHTHEALYWEVPNYNWAELRYPKDWLMQGLRMGDWKLLRHNSTKAWELYDLATDPSESKDVAAKHPEVVKKMTDWIARNRTEPIPQVEPEMPEGKDYR